VNIALAALFFFILHLVVSVVIQRSFSLVAVETILLFPAHCPLSPPSELRLQRRDGDAKPWRFLRALRHDRRPINLRIAPAAFFFSLLLLLLFSLVGSIIKRVISVVAIQTILLLPTHCPLRPLAQLGLQMWHGHAKPWRFLWALWHDRRPLNVRIALALCFLLLLLLLSNVASIVKLITGADAINTVVVLPTHCPLRPIAELRVQRRHGNAKPWHLFQVYRHDRRPLGLPLVPASLLLFLSLFRKIEVKLRKESVHGLIQSQARKRRWGGLLLARVSLLFSLFCKAEAEDETGSVHWFIQAQANKRRWRGRTDL